LSFDECEVRDLPSTWLFDQGCVIAARTAAMSLRTPVARDETRLAFAFAIQASSLAELRKRFKSGSALPADPDTLAQYVLTVAWGMAVAAQSGASRDDLHGAVKLALKSWPA
jgi:hypothetical protein